MMRGGGGGGGGETLDSLPFPNAKLLHHAYKNPDTDMDNQLLCITQRLSCPMGSKPDLAYGHKGYTASCRVVRFHTDL